jgi:hypothetical protein
VPWASTTLGQSVVRRSQRRDALGDLLCLFQAHYDRPRPARNRGPRTRTATEQQFRALGADAEAFLVGAAAIGNSRPGSELEALLGLGAAHGADTQPRPPGEALILDLPVDPTRSPDAYTVTSAADGGVPS